MSSQSNIIKGSLARKLVIAVSLIIIIGGGISWYVIISNARGNLIRSAIEDTGSHSDLVKKSVRYSMLTAHPDAIQQIVENIGARKDIEVIRIFDSRGKVFYSSRNDEIGEMVKRDSFVCIGCHTDPERPSESLSEKRQWTIQRSGEGHRVLTYVNPIMNEPSCSTAACHVHPEDQRVLGVLETDFSLITVDSNIHKLIMETIFYSIVLMLLGAVILFFILRKLVIKPVADMSDAMHKVAEGDLTHKVTIDSGDEMSMLADSFNSMTDDLGAAREKMKEWNRTLEEEVEKKTAELRKSHGKLIQAEKLASLGRLTSDIAHEIRNPLTAIGGFARRLYKLVETEKKKEYADVMIAEVIRLEKILGDVLTFSRNPRNNLKPHDITAVVSETMELYRGICNEHAITIMAEKKVDLPPVLIDNDQVKQALGNLITNAIDAMHEGGTLTVRAEMEELHRVPYVTIRVSDTGEGIPEEKLPFIFDPFFSTKAIHGTGLGLSITLKIIEEHGGFIKAERNPEKGMTISLYIPYQSDEESLKIKCWEYMQCRRDKDASLKCPSYPHFGRLCWAVAGTFCQGKVQGTFAQKYENCMKCRFYQEVNKDTSE